MTLYYLLNNHLFFYIILYVIYPAEIYIYIYIYVFFLMNAIMSNTFANLQIINFIT